MCSASWLPALWTPVSDARSGFMLIRPDKLWQSESNMKSSPSLSITWLHLCVIILLPPCRVYRVLIWVCSCRTSFIGESGFIPCVFCLVFIPNARSPVFCLIVNCGVSSVWNFVHLRSQSWLRLLGLSPITQSSLMKILSSLPRYKQLDGCQLSASFQTQTLRWLGYLLCRWLMLGLR